MTSSWFFLSTLNYDARSTTHQPFPVRIWTACPRNVRYSTARSSSSMPYKQSPELTFIYRNALWRFQIPRFCSFYRHDHHQFHQPHNYIMKYVNDTPKVKSNQSLCDYLLHKQKIPLDILLWNFNGTLVYKWGAMAWLLWLNTLSISGTYLLFLWQRYYSW